MSTLNVGGKKDRSAQDGGFYHLKRVFSTGLSNAGRESERAEVWKGNREGKPSRERFQKSPLFLEPRTLKKILPKGENRKRGGGGRSKIERAFRKNEETANSPSYPPTTAARSLVRKKSARRAGSKNKRILDL